MADATVRPPEKTLEIHGPGETGWLSSAEVAALTPESVRARVAALKPMIAEHAEEAERLRRPHPAVWEALRATGYFYHFVPRKYGGCEFGPEDFFITSRLIAEACASTSWAATFVVEHNWIASLYPEKAQDEFFAHGRYIVAPAVSTPPGMATKEPGGYRVTARWKWGSGVANSNWGIGMAVLPGEGEKPTTLWVAFPLSQAKVLDTWHVAGLAATASNDIIIDNLFIPEHMAIAASDMQFGTTPGGKLHANPVYRMPSTAFLSLVTSAPTIGAARGAVNLFREKLKTRKVVGTQTILAEKSNMQVMLAKADLMVGTAELLFMHLTRSVLARAANGQNGDVSARMESTAMNAYASHMARDAIRLIIDNAGSSVHNLSDPLQRMSRDANVACSHVIQDFESLAEQHGRQLLGLPPITFFF